MCAAACGEHAQRAPPARARLPIVPACCAPPPRPPRRQVPQLRVGALLPHPHRPPAQVLPRHAHAGHAAVGGGEPRRAAARACAACAAPAPVPWLRCARCCQRRTAPHLPLRPAAHGRRPTAALAHPPLCLAPRSLTVELLALFCPVYYPDSDRILLEQCDKPSLFQARGGWGRGAGRGRGDPPTTSPVPPGCPRARPPPSPCAHRHASPRPDHSPQAITFSSANRFKMAGQFFNITQSATVNA